MTKLDRAALEEKLAGFEDMHAVATGARLLSADFHDRYLKGAAVEIPNALEWASYYELYREQAHAAVERTAQSMQIDEARRRMAVAGS